MILYLTFLCVFVRSVTSLSSFSATFCVVFIVFIVYLYIVSFIFNSHDYSEDITLSSLLLLGFPLKYQSQSLHYLAIYFRHSVRT